MIKNCVYTVDNWKFYINYKYVGEKWSESSKLAQFMLFLGSKC